MLKRVKEKIIIKKAALLNSIANRIREKAIAKAKVRIILHGRTVNDYTEDELEIIVNEEEGKIKDDLKTKSFVFVLAFLGLNSL